MKVISFIDMLPISPEEVTAILKEARRILKIGVETLALKHPELYSNPSVKKSE